MVIVKQKKKAEKMLHVSWWVDMPWFCRRREYNGSATLYSILEATGWPKHPTSSIPQVLLGNCRGGNLVLLGSRQEFILEYHIRDEENKKKYLRNM